MPERVAPCLFLALVLGSGISRADATFLVVDTMVTNDREGRSVAFEITFSKPPDFLTVDVVGRQASEFQYYIDNEARYSSPGSIGSGLDVLIRGGEIARTGHIVVRLAGGDEGGPESGGWGAALGLVPFTLNGAKLEFSVPWGMLHESDGRFSYHLLLVEHGVTSDERSGLAGP